MRKQSADVGRMDRRDGPVRPERPQHSITSIPLTVQFNLHAKLRQNGGMLQIRVSHIDVTRAP